MLAPLAMIAAFLWPFPGHAATFRTTHQKVAGWTLNVRTNRFADDHRCRLAKGPVSLTRDVLVFRLSPGLDTAAARYRVDGGALHAASGDLMSVAQAGLAIYDDQLANPSGGLVRIPAERVRHAKRIAIQATAASTPKVFDLDGLDAALAQAAKLGCEPTAFE
jgi:hypothetical protein